MSLESRVAVQETLTDTHGARLDSHSNRMDGIEKIASQNTLSIAGLVTTVGILSRIVYGGTGLVLVACIGAGMKIILGD